MFLTKLLLAAVLSTPAAPPAGDPSDEAPRSNHLGLNLGIGSPVGGLGVTYDRDLGHSLQLQAGVGAGESGWQVSVMPRFVLRLGERHALFAGAGPSLGIPMTPQWTRPLVVWANGEAGYQYERRAFFLQLGLGASLLLRGKIRPVCFLCDVPDWGPGTALPALRITAGFRF